MTTPTMGAMTTKGTTQRSVRIDPGLWEAAQDAAASRGETVADVIRRALAKYARGTPPDRDDVAVYAALLQEALRRSGKKSVADAVGLLVKVARGEEASR